MTEMSLKNTTLDHVLDIPIKGSKKFFHEKIG